MQHKKREKEKKKGKEKNRADENKESKRKYVAQLVFINLVMEVP
jgi:hypothetical protein